MPEWEQKKVWFKKQTMDTDNETKKTEEPQAETGADFMKKLIDAMAASQKQTRQFTVSVDVVANSPDAAVQAVDAVMNSRANVFDAAALKGRIEGFGHFVPTEPRVTAEKPFVDNHVSKHTVCVDVYAPTKEQAHAAVGMMLRSDSTMFTLDEFPYTKGCRVDWESLRMQDGGFSSDPMQLPLLMMAFSMLGRK